MAGVVSCRWWRGPAPVRAGRPGQARSMRMVVSLLIVLLALGQSASLLAADYFGLVTFNGVPVPGVTITATKGDRSIAATTSQDGIYQLADLADGDWNLHIEMLGFAPIQRLITVPDTHEPSPETLAVRAMDELVRAEAPAQATPAAPFPRAALKS